jgi:murein DD-endopeptidase MepM/ murein hydrolase activator NlpD
MNKPDTIAGGMAELTTSAKATVSPPERFARRRKFGPADPRGMTPLAPAPGDSPARVAELAHQFESLFIAQMLRQMRQSLTMAGDEEGENGHQFGAMTDTIDTQLAQQLSAAGGIGIADVIMKAFDRQQPSPPVSTGPALVPIEPPAEAPRALAIPSVPLPLGQHITSAFGWRKDPISGDTRFHKGVDVRAAYGQNVPAAAGGTVVQAGEQGGYGLTVVIEHGSGIRTRYAHLSEVAVRQGDSVAAGQDIGRVGRSGRSTGPHLHFEVLADGQPVDPVQVAAKIGLVGGLKPAGVDADSTSVRPSAEAATEE